MRKKYQVKAMVDHPTYYLVICMEDGRIESCFLSKEEARALAARLN